MSSVQKEPSMNAVQIDQKSYEMPPREGISIAHFLTVADVERSARYYEKVFGARILSMGDGNAPPYLQLANIWTDPRQADGNAQRPRPESHQQLYEFPRCRHSSVLQVVEKSGSRVHYGTTTEVRRDSLLHPRS
jgi:predicted enzyme related to lactoylglutathione lyase